MTDGSGAVQAHYEYDMYGVATKTNGALDADFQYAGYYAHGPSGLNLTVYRAYSPMLGRWINRDPVEEDGGVNLFEYCQNMPTRLTDPRGLTSPQLSEGIVDSVTTSLLPSMLAEDYAHMAESQSVTANVQPQGARGAGPADAFRHCLWSCLMASDSHVGPWRARQIGENHERAGTAGGQSAAEAGMDRENNYRGRKMAKCPGNCYDKCKRALMSGGLVGLNGGDVMQSVGPAFGH